jgi:hypothetical protein
MKNMMEKIEDITGIPKVYSESSICMIYIISIHTYMYLCKYRGKCTSHPDVINVMDKIEEIMGIPKAHSESFQVLKYNLGQAYNAHHDYGGG